MGGFGFIKMSRKFLTNDMWTERRTFSKAEAWIDLLFTASHERQTTTVVGLPVELRRGELVASDSFLMKRWRWSRNKVRLFLRNLEIEGRVRLIDHPEANQTGKIIYIENYDHYQA